MGRTGLDSSVNFCSSSTIMLLVRCCCCITVNMACSNGESLGAASEALSEVLSTAISPSADVLRFWFVGWPEPEVIGNESYSPRGGLVITNAPRGVGEATKAKTNDDERREKTLYSDVRRGRTEEGYGKEAHQWCVATGRNIARSKQRRKQQEQNRKSTGIR